MSDRLQDRSAPGIRLTVLRGEKDSAGEPLDLQGRVLGFSYEDSERKTDKVSLQLDNFDLSLFEREELLGGSLLEVSWGYPGNMAPPRRVTLKSIKGFGTIAVEGLALSALMNREVKTRHWENKPRSEIVREIAEENGFEGAFVYVDESPETFDVLNQCAETDARFLRRLAAREELEFWVDDTGLHFHERKQDTAPTHVFTWFSDPGRGDVLSVSVESDLVKRVGKVTVKGRDPKEKTTVESSSTSAKNDRSTLGDVKEAVDPESGETSLEQRNATATTHASPASTAKQVEKEASARFRAAERATVKLSMQVVGDPTLRAKSVVEVRGISPLLSGKYYVTEVRHSISSSGYTCDLKLTRDGKGRVPTRKAQAQQGEPNRHQAKDKDEPRQVEAVDAETGKTRVEYYP
jgi:phage protein D